MVIPNIVSPIPSVIITAVVVTLGSPSFSFFMYLARESPSSIACAGISMFESDRFPSFTYKYKIIVLRLFPFALVVVIVVVVVVTVPTISAVIVVVVVVVVVFVVVVVVVIL